MKLRKEDARVVAVGFAFLVALIVLSAINLALVARG